MAADWIFQAQPKRFRIDTFLTRKPTSTSWLASQHAEKILTGDRVFLWRSIGGGLRDESGIFAEARVVAPAKPLPSPPDERDLWANDADRRAIVKRVRIKFRQVADKGNLLRRRFLEDDPILGDLSIFERPRQTNYPISVEQADRIAIVWAALGSPWTRDELVAALWLTCLRRRETEAKPSDALTEFALRSGRSVTSVRVVVETFFRMNPERPSSQQDFGNTSERQVWDEFFDASLPGIDLPSLNGDYVALWGVGRMPIVAPDGGVLFPSTPVAMRLDSGREASLLDRTLVDLTAEYLRTASNWKDQDASTDASQSVIGLRTATVLPDRSRLVGAIAKVRANFRCEVTDCSVELFRGLDWRPYVEVHHIIPLSESGPDIPENVAAVCPSHHREAHHGTRAPAIRDDLTRLRTGRSFD